MFTIIATVVFLAANDTQSSNTFEYDLKFSTMEQCEDYRATIQGIREAVTPFAEANQLGVVSIVTKCTKGGDAK